MNAIHINSAAPFFAKRGVNCSYSIPDYDLYCTALSALLWRKYNGRIHMLCDNTVYNYYRRLGITDLWDNLMPMIPEDLEGINPKMFWAAGKILALRTTEAPVVMLDTDFLVWKSLELSDRIVCAHRENLMPDVYPDPSFFRNKGFSLNPKFNREALPCNTAFLYLPDEGVKEFYTSQSVAFMKTAEDCDDYLCHMVFAEQRLLAMCGDYLGAEIDALLDKDKLFVPQESFSHLWGAKRVMAENKAERIAFCEKMRGRLLRDFPKYGYIADIIDAQG